jgi:hypothetical protein
MLLVQVAAVLTGAIFIINVALHKPVITVLLFSLSIAVGITPQLLPAVVSTSLAAGSRQLARPVTLSDIRQPILWWERCATTWLIGARSTSSTWSLRPS